MAAPRRTVLSALAAFVIASAVARGADAQVHWDASATAGPALRAVRSSSPADATVGGAVQVASHVALFPLVRVGIALSGEVEPISGTPPPRWLGGGSVRARIFTPWPSGTTRVFLHGGVGLALAHGAGYLPPGAVAPASSAGGRFVEVPFGLGTQVRVWGPYAFTAELGLRYGFGHAGALYDGSYPAGAREQLGLGLLLGVQYDR